MKIIMFIFCFIFVIQRIYADTCDIRMVVSDNDQVVDGNYSVDVEIRVASGFTQPRTLNSLTVDVSYTSSLASVTPDTIASNWFSLYGEYECAAVSLSDYYRVLITGNDIGSGTDGWDITNEWQKLVTLNWKIAEHTLHDIKIDSTTKAAAYFYQLHNDPEDFVSNWNVFLPSSGLPVRLQTISLINGWNLFSLALNPEGSINMLDLVAPIQDHLIKIVDEQGNTVEKLLGNWKNTIGDWQSTEGYYIKMDDNINFQKNGNLLNDPFSIPLSAGWNMSSFPCFINEQDALAALEDLIDNGYLLKVINEQGNTVEQILGTWENTIGNFSPGEGYYIKVAEACTLNIDCNGAVVLAKADKQVIFPVHFFNRQPGNPYMPMSIYIVPSGKGWQDLEIGDEIGLFDGDICVGSAVCVNKSKPVQIVASSHDGDSLGFQQGNPMIIKIWQKDTGSESVLSSDEITTLSCDGTIIQDPIVFERLATRIISFEKSISDMTIVPTEYKLYQNFPNPFNPTTTIIYDLPQGSMVHLDIFDINGRKVRDLFKGRQKAGHYNFVWDGTNSSGVKVVSGVYFYRLTCESFSATNKMILVK